MWRANIQVSPHDVEGELQVSPHDVEGELQVSPHDVEGEPDVAVRARACHSSGGDVDSEACERPAHHRQMALVVDRGY